jgi:hypothetical protein
MKNIPNLTSARWLQSKEVRCGLVLGIVLLMAAAVPTHADDMRDRGRAGNQHKVFQNRGQHKRVDKDWNNHEWQARRYWSRPYYEEPSYVYAPPLVYAPPVYERPGISFIIPLNIN